MTFDERVDTWVKWQTQSEVIAADAIELDLGGEA